MGLRQTIAYLLSNMQILHVKTCFVLVEDTETVDFSRNCSGILSLVRSLMTPEAVASATSSVMREDPPSVSITGMDVWGDDEGVI